MWERYPETYPDDFGSFIPELAGLGNVNKLSVSEFDNPCLNSYVIFSLCFSICVDVFEISIGVSHN